MKNWRDILAALALFAALAWALWTTSASAQMRLQDEGVSQGKFQRR
jgi:hypothetical protein